MNRLLRWLAGLGQLLTVTGPAVVERKRSQRVSAVLWREKQHCHDDAYSQQLAPLIAGARIGWETRWQDRPLAMEVEAALWEACHMWPRALEVWATPLAQLIERRQRPELPQELVADLQHPDWISRFTARHTLVTLGGEAVPHLAAAAGQKNGSLRQIAAWLLRSIEEETGSRLAPFANCLLCPRCLARCRANLAHPAGLDPHVYYGCRACGQGQEFWRYSWLVAVLDSDRAEEMEAQAELLRVNWLVRRSLFDFDEVEIIRATDEEVERFAIQVGNDTDPFRKPRYSRMRCSVGQKCFLAENTIRILKQRFGNVEYVNSP